MNLNKVNSEILDIKLNDKKPDSNKNLNHFFSNQKNTQLYKDEYLETFGGDKVESNGDIEMFEQKPTKKNIGDNLYKNDKEETNTGPDNELKKNSIQTDKNYPKAPDLSKNNECNKLRSKTIGSVNNLFMSNVINNFDNQNIQTSGLVIDPANYRTNLSDESQNKVNNRHSDGIFDKLKLNHSKNDQNQEQNLKKSSGCEQNKIFNQLFKIFMK